jgi:hypothetical protein
MQRSGGVAMFGEFEIAESDSEWAFKFDGTSPAAKDFVIRLRKTKP